MELTCFKAYDVRGELGVNIDAEICYRIGRSFAQTLNAKSVVVGRDARETSPELADAVARGIMDAGMELIVHQNPEAKEKGINPFDHGALHTDMWKTEGLKQALDKHGFDAAFEVRAGMKKNHVPRNVCFPSVPPNTDGNPRRNAQSFGRFIMHVRPRAKACASFHCQTGRNWTSGSISIWKALKSYRCILRRHVQLWNGMV